MRTALIIVDMQNDFLPGGSLPVPDGDTIIENLIRAAYDVDLVVATRDWHPPDHVSFKQWGSHCVQRTPGSRIVPKLRRLANFTISKGMDLRWDSYSGFDGHTLRPERTLQEILQKHGINQVLVGGVCFDICVKHTALDAHALGYRTLVPLNITKPLTSEGFTLTCEQFDKAGVHLCDHFENHESTIRSDDLARSH